MQNWDRFAFQGYIVHPIRIFQLVTTAHAPTRAAQHRQNTILIKILTWGNIPSLFLSPDLKCCITCLDIWLLKCSLVESEFSSYDVINRRCPECTAVSFSQFLRTSKFFEHSHIRPLVLFVSARKNIYILLATETGVQPTWNMVKMN